MKGRSIRPYDLKCRITYRQAEELTPIPACPTARIAADLHVREFSYRRRRLGAGGRPTGQVNPFLIQYPPLTEAEMEKVAGHNLFSPNPASQSRLKLAVE